ncbi:molybdopterin-containing oxidoreductase family protein [Candidatus Nitrospira neomarina]|uniref:Molybdopterin-dependent oxidoreductase n=1 Tax=Candidatus Nitrospira neomarina TaxID=3020899 RepID=A0AA96GS70_9BACT|nr:molybdopterin-dependent oxidoreductase [Candidatus Nitrospira neomarina]WNM62576.1 molybdopterin-dependent oxidoreductase [Candidatus Nitrospira neomarina]
MDLYRRTLFKILGLTAAGSSLPGCEREVHNLVPYLLPDEDIVPGVANWYASTCQECEAGCGTMVRVMEGRAKKIEGNPKHPVNEGKLCARGQAALQGLYNPDRLQGPLRREGKRGQGQFRPITWEEGLAEWVEQLGTHAGKSAMVARPMSGTLASLLTTMMDSLSGRLVMYESTGEQTLRTANHLSFGTHALPYYDLANADYLLSFGAPFLEHWLSPVSFGVAYGKFRQGRPLVRGRFIQVEPRLSLTASNADQWIPLRPGTEGLLAMGIGQVLLRDGLTGLSSFHRPSFHHTFSAFSLEDISANTEVSQEVMTQVAHELASANAPLVLGGGPAAAQTNGTSTLILINALNVMIGAIGRRGGLQWMEPPDSPVDLARPGLASERTLLDLAREFEQGSRTLLHLYRADPLFTLPPSLKFERVFDHAQFIVSFSSFLDDSTLMADLILPDHDPLESWGDVVQQDTTPVPIWSASQPVVRALYDTRPIGDVWLEAAHRLGGSLRERVPWNTHHDMLKSRWQTVLTKHDSPQSVDTRWRETLQKGGLWPSNIPMRQMNPVLPSVTYEPPQFLGNSSDYPLYCYPYPSLGLHDGRGANRPWLQELPDPLTTGMWGSWIELNPTTAQALGIHPGDRVRVTSDYGSIEASVMVFPGLHPDMIAVPMGQGHRAYGRYAQGRGMNPMVLLGPSFDQQSGSLATGGTRVRVERIKGGSRLPMLEQSGKNPVFGRIQETGGL